MTKYLLDNYTKSPYCQVTSYLTVTFQRNVLSRYIISYCHLQEQLTVTLHHIILLIF